MVVVRQRQQLVLPRQQHAPKIIICIAHQNVHPLHLPAHKLAGEHKTRAVLGTSNAIDREWYTGQPQHRQIDDIVIAVLRDDAAIGQRCCHQFGMLLWIFSGQERAHT